MPLIVIEGLDGSGKSTQVKLLKDFLQNQQISFEFLHFPRMDSPVFGEMVAKFLRGELGELENVNPYIVALLYAGDRMDASNELKNWLKEGKLVLLDRYVCSNIAYQCAKIDHDQEKDILARWILNMEYTFFQIPKPDLNIYLDVPFNFVSQNLKSQRMGNDREYLKGNTDIHEANLGFQEKVRQVYLRIRDLQLHEHYEVLECFGMNNQMLTVDEVHEKLKQLILEKKLMTL